MRALVTSGGQRHWLLQKVLDRSDKFSIIVFLAALGYAWFILQAVNSEHTRISEHALMPGLVTEKFDMEGKAVEYIRDLEKSDKLPYICTSLLNMGISCDTQYWSTNVKIQNSSGNNVYGTVRASRATGVEAMLIVADLKDTRAVGMAMAYAAFAREQVYWARDLFFLFVDGGAMGLDAWLSAYHHVKGAGIEGEPLKEFGGLLIGGVVLKKHSKNSKASEFIELEVNNINGQLPNLDLFNSIVRIAGKGKFGLRSVIYGAKEHQQEWLIPARAVYTQAFVAVEGIHSVMGKYGVQGLTVAVPTTYKLGSSIRLLEAVARSMNNVLERFHQSYFLYVLTSEDNFVSIAYFMPIIGGLIAPLLIHAYCDWCELKVFRMQYVLLRNQAIGLVVYMAATTYFSQYCFDLKRDVLVLLGALAFPYGLLPLGRITCARSLRFLLLLQCALITGAVALLNFSLAFCFATVAVLVILLINSKKLPSVIKVPLCLASHPLSVYLLFVLYGLPYLEYGKKPARADIQMVTTAIVRSVKEHLVYGSNLFPLLCAVVLPMWNTLLLLAGKKIEA